MKEKFFNAPLLYQAVKAMSFSILCFLLLYLILYPITANTQINKSKTNSNNIMSTWGTDSNTSDSPNEETGLEIYTNENGDRIMRTPSRPSNNLYQNGYGNTFNINPEIYTHPPYNYPPYNNNHNMPYNNNLQNFNQKSNCNQYNRNRHIHSFHDPQQKSYFYFREKQRPNQPINKNFPSISPNNNTGHKNSKHLSHGPKKSSHYKQ